MQDAVTSTSAGSVLKPNFRSKPTWRSSARNEWFEAFGDHRIDCVPNFFSIHDITPGEFQLVEQHFVSSLKYLLFA